jgi:hypothetical protein
MCYYGRGRQTVRFRQFLLRRVACHMFNCRQTRLYFPLRLLQNPNSWRRRMNDVFPQEQSTQWVIVPKQVGLASSIGVKRYFVSLRSPAATPLRLLPRGGWRLTPSISLGIRQQGMHRIAVLSRFSRTACSAVPSRRECLCYQERR